MTMNEIMFYDEARENLAKGMNVVANAVKCTLGPSGRNVIISRENLPPHITKDGVTVAKEIRLKDPFMSMGADLIKNIASKTCDDAGDGTSNSVVLAQSLVNQSLDIIKRKDVNPILLKNYINKYIDYVTGELESKSIKITSDSDLLKYVATISANNDSEIGEYIANAFKAIGEHGNLTVNKSNTHNTYLKTECGFNINRGYLNQYFITDKSKNQCVLNNPYIFITDRKMKAYKDLYSVVGLAVTNKRDLFVIADDVTEEALGLLSINAVQNNINICAIRGPEYGANRKANLEDLCALTGATLFSLMTSGGKLGEADKIIVDANNTIIIGAKGKKENIDIARNNIISLLNTVNNEFDKKLLQARLARFSNSIAELYVGAKTEIEINEKMDRIEDSVCATKSALEEGILPGGGVAYINIYKKMKSKFKTFECEEESEAFNIVTEAIINPFKTIASNCGRNANEIFKSICKSSNFNYGYDFKNSKYGDMISFGVIDSAKVVKSALNNAASIVSLFITTECAILTNIE